MLHAKATLRAGIRRLEEYLKTEINAAIICDINEQIEEHLQAIALVENLDTPVFVVPKSLLPYDLCKEIAECPACESSAKLCFSHQF